MKKVMLVFGTRPEAIKMCPLVNELKARTDEFETVVTVTGQHREMLDQKCCASGVTPDHDLAIMKPGQTLFDVTCDVLLKLKAVLEDEKPDVVLRTRRYHDQLRRCARVLLPADPCGPR